MPDEQTQTKHARSALVVAPRVRRIPPLFEAVSLRWIKHAPFFAEFMFRFHFFETRDIPSTGVNCIRGNINFYFNPDFIYRERDTLEGLIIHEIEHLIRLHRERVLEDPPLFYTAADMLINENIKTLKINNTLITLPEGALYLAMIRNPPSIPGSPALTPYTGEPVTEPVYRWLAALHQDLQPGAVNDTGSDGTDKSGAATGHGSGVGMFHSPIDEHKFLETSDEVAESTLGKIIESALIRGWGTMGGTGVYALQALLKPTTIPWTQRLRRLLSPLLYDYGPYFEHTWARRNRRNLPLPGIRRLSNKLVIAVDTSGSLGKQGLQQFFTEIEKIVKDFSQLIVIQWDTCITNVQETYKRGDWKSISIKGGGGTMVQCVFDWMREQG
ncbi:MAG: VWA-like domain-containing protein, partial [Treponema sp.]|nr:VWA-like domain-containing protein [Treponema sp.]